MQCLQSYKVDACDFSERMQIVDKNIVMGCYCDCNFRRLQQWGFLKLRTDNPIKIQLVCSMGTRE